MKILSKIKYAVMDSFTMFKRCMLLSFRNLDSLITGILIPVLMMFLFVYVFGGSMNVGDGSYVNYIVPGVILQCVGQCAAITAISVNNDMKKGIIDRFRSMPITKSSVLTGHASAAIIRNMVTTALVIGVALLIGFRPTANITQWLVVIGILFIYIMAITWLSIIFGLVSNSAESAQVISIVILLLSYFSSGFVATESMPTALRAFAENQPLTPIIETIRSLLMNTLTDGNMIIAITWCIAIFAVSYMIAVQIYRRRLAK